MKRIVLAGVAMVALAGCSGMRETFGLDRNSPDEFAVMSRAPLSVPPDFELRPPAPGMARPQEPSIRDQAATAVFGKEAAANMQDNTETKGEEILLSKAGADKAMPDIRNMVDRETAGLVLTNRTTVERLMFWNDPTGDTKEPVVNAPKEAARIRKAKEDGVTPAAASTGDTPTIVRRKKGVLEDVF